MNGTQQPGRENARRSASLPVRVRVAALSLTELLAVVAVVSLLAAMLLAGTRVVRAALSQMNCARHESQLMTTILAYSGDNRGFLPPRIYFNGVDPSYSQNDTDYFLSYLDNPVKTWGSTGKGSLYAFGQMALRCPSVYDAWKPNAVAMGFVTDYASGNTGLIKTSEAATQFGANGDLFPPYKSSTQVKGGMFTGTSQTATLFCGNNHFTMSFNAGTIGRYALAGDNGVEWPQFPHKARTTMSTFTQTGATLPFTTPMDGYCNIAFLDGHVEPRRAQQSATFAAVIDGGVPLVRQTGIPALATAPHWSQFWLGR